MHFRIIILIFCSSFILNAQSYFKFVLPELSPTPSASSLSLGRTSSLSATPNGLIFSQPSSLINLYDKDKEQRFQFISDFDFMIDYRSESRSFIILDYFGGYLTDANSVFNQNNYNYSSLGFAVMSSIPIIDVPLAIGIGKSNIMDANYSFLEEVRDDQSSSNLYRDILVGYHAFETKGNIDAIGISISTKLLNRVNFGLSVINQHSTDINIYRDTLEISSNTDNIAADGEEYDLTFNLNSDNYVVLGVSSKLFKYFDLGFTYQSVTENSFKSDEFNAQIDSDYLLPIYSAGSSEQTFEVIKPEKKTSFIKFNNPLHHEFSVALEYSILNYSKYNLYLYDVKEFHIGFEADMIGKPPFRVGLSHYTSPFRNDLSSTSFSGGSGFNLNNFKLDFGFEYKYLNYNYIDIFAPSNDPSNPQGIENVKENLLIFKSTLSYRF